MAHLCAMLVAPFAVSFGHNTSYVIRETECLSWKGWCEYQFQHNMSKWEFHCISGFYYYSDSKPYSIPQANTLPSRLHRDATEKTEFDLHLFFTQ